VFAAPLDWTTFPTVAGTIDLVFSDPVLSALDSCIHYLARGCDGILKLHPSVAQPYIAQLQLLTPLLTVSTDLAHMWACLSQVYATAGLSQSPVLHSSMCKLSVRSVV